MEQLTVFRHDGDGEKFEDFAQENGATWFPATRLMQELGYANMKTFNNAIQKAIKVCISLGIPIQGNFDTIANAQGLVCDYKLSRFACYLTATHSDTRKPQVREALVYFAAYTAAFREYVLEEEHVSRVGIRADISEHQVALQSLAKKAGVEDFAIFLAEGYRGLYNMHINKLRVLKRVPEGRSPLDFMGRTELAANLFRITQTEEKIRIEDIKGDPQLRQTAFDVGRKVRDTMQEISGVPPESLPPAQDINKVKSGLKGAHREFKKVDARKLKEARDKK